MYRFRWRIQKFLNKFIYNERSSRWVRLFFTFSLTFSMVLLGYTIFEEPFPESRLVELREHFPYLFIIPGFLLRFSYFVFYGFRHMIIPFAAFLGVLMASAFYVKDVYELPKVSLGRRYILAAFLGIGYPSLRIAEGKKQIPKGEVNLIDTIGGPGYVHIRPGNVVLFENLRSPSSVRANTVNFISRFETIKEIVSLDDQHGFINETKARTKDGIEIVVRDVHYRYRLRTGRRFGDHEKRKAVDPYPFSVQAVQHMAYRRSVRVNPATQKTELTSWNAAIQLTVDSAITDYIKEHKFDQLTAPNFEDDNPRAEITKNMMSRGVRTRLRNVGAELLWFDMGHFSVSEQVRATVEDQRADTWSARLDGAAMIVRSHGEAKRLAYQDMGRAEGQADMLLSIIQALEEASFETGNGPEERRPENLRRIIWARVAQIFDAIAEEEKKFSSELPPRSTSE